MVHKQILGHDIEVCYGTIRDKADYDDGWLYSLISQCSVMFDVGCNIGLFSLLACLDNSHRKVVAIEANAEALTTTANNLFNNGFSQQIQFVLAFVSDSVNKNIDFYTVGTGAAGSRFQSHAKTASTQNAFQKVKTTTLDKVYEDLNLLPDFIKMDIEGAEIEALMGATKLASHKKTRFIVEMHSTQETSMKERGYQVLGWADKAGYDTYYLKEHKLVNSPNIFAHRGRCHILLQPEGWPYPSYLKEIKQSDSLEKSRSMLHSHQMNSNAK